MLALVDQSIALISWKSITKALEAVRVSCDQGCSAKQRLVLGHAIGLSPSLSLGLSLLLGDALRKVST